MRTPFKARTAPLLALMLAMGALLLAGANAALAAEPPDELPPITVDEVWLTGDTLHITVTDITSGESQSLELNLSDYANYTDEYVTIQATDSSGGISNSIQFRNPYYVADSGQQAEGGEGGGSQPPAAFTPDGTGTVIDNAAGGDGKEFFTVETEAGNVFYLIVDRQRNTENVYLLNAVTEDDLAALAQQGGAGSAGAAFAPVQPAPAEPPETTAEPEPPPPAGSSGGNTGTVVLVILAALGAGGAGYYFKIVRPKQNGAGDDEDYDEPDGGAEYEDDDELDADGDSEEVN